MKLIVIILNQPERLNHLMDHLASLGVDGATVLESEGMGKILSEDAGLVARYGHLLSGVRPFNRTILSVIPDDRLAELVLDSLQREVELVDSVGLAFALPVDRLIQLRPL